MNSPRTPGAPPILRTEQSARCGPARSQGPASTPVRLTGRPPGGTPWWRAARSATGAATRTPSVRAPAEPRVRRDGQPPELPNRSLRVDPTAASVPVVRASHHPLPRCLSLPGSAPALGLVGGHASIHQGITAASATSLEESFVLVDHLRPHQLLFGHRASLRMVSAPFRARPQRLSRRFGESDLSLGLRSSTMTPSLAQLNGKRKYQVHPRTLSEALPCATPGRQGCPHERRRARLLGVARPAHALPEHECGGV